MSRQPLPADTILGKDSDQYRIDTVLGPGGFGITYLARSLRLDRDVAIKEYFPAEFAYREGSTTIRSSGSGAKDFFTQGKRHFVEEARVLGKFRHQHIVRVIGLLEEHNTAYMVLEFEEGQSFKHWLRELRRPPTQEELDTILEPMLSALESIHDKGIFHRDIAPDNIIVRPDGRPVLIDFGAARHFARETSHTIGAIVKHGYSPPEQYTLDTKLQGAWSDIYALSATMYHAIMGQPPEEASKRQLQDSMLPIEEHMDAFNKTLYHPSFLAGINAGLTLKPRDRPATIGALRAILMRGRGNDHPEDVTEATIGGKPPVFDDRRRPTTPSRPHRSDSRPLHSQGTVVRQASVQLASGRLAEPAVAPVEPSAYPERAARAAGYVAIVIAAASALGFLMIGGSYHPDVILPVLAICAGLCLATLERGVALFRPDTGHLVTTAASAAVVSALVLAIFWLPFSFYPLSIVLVGLAAAFAWFRYGNWVPATLVIVATLHFALALWMLLGRFEFAARPDGVQPNPYFWPLMASCLAIISLLAMVSAVQMRRRTPGVAA